MKQILSIAFCAIFLWGCQENGTHPSQTTVTNKTPTESSNSETMSIEERLAKFDPVCDMERDAAWTDSLAYNNQMVHFCSATCKNAFEAQPDKYLK